jgi:hypothetical protein
MGVSAYFLTLLPLDSVTSSMPATYDDNYGNARNSPENITLGR